MVKTLKKCLNCNEIFELPFGKNDKRTYKRKFCTRTCFLDNNIKKSKNIRFIRLKILERAHNKCEKCGTGGKLHIHHIKPAVYYPNGHSPLGNEQNSPENLIALCVPCHKKEHPRDIERFTGKSKCIACGKKYKYYPKNNRGLFCSRDCFYENRKLIYAPKNYVCKQCGLAYQALTTSLFCSNQCKSRWHHNANKRRKK